MDCSACNTPINGNYCTNCGQKYDNKKLGFKSVLSDILSSLTDVEKSVFLNIYSIIRYPKKVINNYWEGFRGYYYKPGRMLFYFVTIAGISTYVLKGRLFGLTFSSQGLSEGLTFCIFFFPILSLSSFLTYWRYKKNYLEHLVATIYLVSAFGIIFLIIESLATYLEFVTDIGSMWIIPLVCFILIWKAILFTTPAKPIKVLVNSILEFVVLVVVFAALGAVLYMSGALTTH
jgi:hypothetical protein